jgi:hypothetical protein
VIWVIPLIGDGFARPNCRRRSSACVLNLRMLVWFVVDENVQVVTAFAGVRECGTQAEDLRLRGQ